ncbi:MAG: DEAD/DEAH box helicase [Deinococcus sp.]|nr:DEAD/DEAH box helicase [Deinococcus sp.]
MVALHGAWLPSGSEPSAGHLFIWGETTQPVSVRRGRRKRAVPGPHPFQATPEEVWAWLSRLDGVPAEPVLQTCILLLPSGTEAPQASPALIGGGSLGGEITEPILTPWEVRGVVLSVPQAMALAFLGGEVVDGVVLGADLRFWGVAARFALELLARQRFVPTLTCWERDGGEEFHAVWEPVLDDPGDAERIALLADAMPAVCRALAPRPLTSKALLASFLDASVDQTMRAWCATRRPARRRAGAAWRWVQALGAPDRAVDAPQVELAALQQSISSWTLQLRAADAGAFRTCFRLEPPEEGAETAWTLRFLLQARDDPSLLVPAAQVWRESGSTLRFLNRRLEHPQEQLLADLGRAARLFPPIEECLRTARPTECTLTTEQAYTFLREAAMLCTESGFGVLVPPWWKQPARVGVQLRLRPQQTTQATGGQGVLGLDTVVEFDWKLALGDQVLSQREFEQLAALKVPLVRLRGQWVELRREQLDAALRLWEGRKQLSIGEVMRLGAGEAALGLPVVDVVAEGWVQQLLRQLASGEQLAELPVPAGFCGELRPYQVRGFSWLAFLRRWGLGACLADDMGLGKTIMLIALLLHEQEQNRLHRPALLICPTSVVSNWERELARFAPSLRVLVHHGAGRRSGDLAQAAGAHHLVISTYALAHRDQQHLAAVAWEGVVLDEAQNIKNPTAKQTQSIRQLKAGYRVALTGTPVENRLAELWSIIDFLNPGYLGGATQFRRSFALPIERGGDQACTERLRRLVQPFILRRVKTDPRVIQDLPEKLEMKVFCTLTPEQATLYQAAVKDMLQGIEASEGIQRRGLVLSALLRLKQLCNHPALFLGDGSTLEGRSGKLARLSEMLEEALAAGDRALVFTQFAEMGGMLQRHLQGLFSREVVFLHGSVPRRARDVMVRRFQEEPDGPPLFILSLKAGGVGLNLTRASHVFHFDRWWNPAVENQATDRAYRIGQRKDVQVHKFICAGTLEERIDALIESKKTLAERVVGSGEQWLTELSTDQLRELLALGDVS